MSNITFNLAQFIVNGTGIQIKANGTPASHKGDINLLNSTGGLETPVARMETYTFQVYVRNEDEVTGSQIIDSIHEFLKKRYNFVIPEITVNAILYPEITVAQCTAMQLPSYIGTDENGAHLFSVNYKVIV